MKHAVTIWHQSRHAQLCPFAYLVPQPCSTFNCPAGDLCVLDSLAPEVKGGVARLVVLALYMLPLPTYMYDSWSPSYIPGWAQRLMHVKQHHNEQDTQLWVGALILKVCHQQAVANPDPKVLLLKTTLPFDFVDLAVLEGIYKQMQLRLLVCSYCPV